MSVGLEKPWKKTGEGASTLKFKALAVIPIFCNCFAFCAAVVPWKLEIFCHDF